MSSSSLPHIVIIPLIHLAHLIRRRRLADLTFFTTPLNAPFLGTSLADVLELPFPEHARNLPEGVESTDALPSISLFLPFVHATKLLLPHFEAAIAALPAVTFLVSDTFLGWTAASAARFGIPHVAFNGMGCFAMTVSFVVAAEKPHSGVESFDEPFAVPGFPGLRLTRSDLHPPFDHPNPSGPMHEFVADNSAAMVCSRGVAVNSFYELEREYVDRWNSLGVGRITAWCVGPVFLEGSANGGELMRWLDAKERPVLYVAFGSQADMSAEQTKEIAMGLEDSGVDFLWVVRDKEVEMCVGGRGRVVSEWVEQVEILRHRSVEGFVTHCGWNSVTESVSAGVPMLAWPLMAEQHLNAKLVTDVLGIGLRVRACDGTKHGLVRREEVAAKAKELMSGEKGRAAKEKVRVLANAARNAVADRRSSAVALEEMIDEISRKRVTSQYSQKSNDIVSS